jgi:uncharacterized protein YdaU (DUF1376 family)
MTLEQEGAYIRLLAYCWREGTLPADPESLSKLCKGCSTDVVTVVAQLFQQAPNDSNRLIHKRLQEEREKQKAYRDKQSSAGKKSAEVRAKGQKPQPALEPTLQRPLEQTLNQKPSLQSSSSSSTSKLASSEEQKSEATIASSPSNLKNNTPEPTAVGASAALDVAQEIYRYYPRKVNDNAALAAIQAALLEIDAQTLLDAVKAYAVEVERTKTKYPIFPAKWFTEKLWKTYVPVAPEVEETSPEPAENDQNFSPFPKGFYQS